MAKKYSTGYYSLRINPKLKNDFSAFCKRKGFTAGKAVNLLAKQFSKKGTIPFSIDGNRSYADENVARMGIYMDANTRQRFSAACDEYGLPMSIIVRGFMDYCVTNDCFPYDAEISEIGRCPKNS